MPSLDIQLVSQTSSVESKFDADVVFKEIEKRLAAEKDEMIQKFKGIFLFELTKGKDVGRWYIDCKREGVVYRGKKDLKPGVTIKMKDDDCVKLMLGKLNPQAAFMQGKIKIAGNMGLAMKLQQLKVGELKSKL